jgi:hypothetical protein
MPLRSRVAEESALRIKELLGETFTRGGLIGTVVEDDRKA